MQRVNRAANGLNYQALLKQSASVVDKFFKDQMSEIASFSGNHQQQLILDTYDQISEIAEHNAYFNHLISEDKFYQDLFKNISIQNVSLAKEQSAI